MQKLMHTKKLTKNVIAPRITRMQRLLASSVLALGICMAILLMTTITTLAGTTVDPNQNALPIGGDQNTYGASVRDPGGKTITESLANLVGGGNSQSDGIIGRLRTILATIAIAVTVYSGLKMLLAQGEEGQVTAAKKGIYMGLIGLGIVSLAGEITQILSVNSDATNAIFYDGGNLKCQGAGTLLDIGTKTATTPTMMCQVNLFNSTVKLVIMFLKYLISAIAVYEIISSGYRIMTLGSESSNLERDKKNIIGGAIGLMVIIFSDGLISKVFYKLDKTYSVAKGVQPKIDMSEGVRQLVAFTNIAVSILGPIAILVLIGASIMYMTSGGNEDKQSQAKRAIIAAAIGVLIIYGAFGIVSTVVSGKFDG